VWERAFRRGVLGNTQCGRANLNARDVFAKYQKCISPLSFFCVLSGLLMRFTISDRPWACGRNVECKN